MSGELVSRKDPSRREQPPGGRGGSVFSSCVFDCDDGADEPPSPPRFLDEVGACESCGQVIESVLLDGRFVAEPVVLLEPAGVDHATVVGVVVQVDRHSRIGRVANNNLDPCGGDGGRAAIALDRCRLQAGQPGVFTAVSFGLASAAGWDVKGALTWENTSCRNW